MSNGDDQTVSFSLRSDSDGEITVKILGYEQPHAADVSDANWLNAEVIFKSGGCYFRYNANITTSDIKYFLDSLEKVLVTLEGVASFLTDEEDIILNLQFNKLGAVNIVGELKDMSFPKTKLTFELSSDQSFFSSVCSDLRYLSKKYPVIESVADRS